MEHELLLCDTTVRCRSDLDAVEQCIRDARNTPNRCSLLDTQAYMHARTRMLQWTTHTEGAQAAEPVNVVYLGGGMVLRYVFLQGGVVHARLAQRHADNDGNLPKAEPQKRVYKQ